MILAFIAGFIIMSIELLGGRILAPYFGSSIYVWGSVITVFMLSLSVGYLTGGKLSLHNQTLVTYGHFLGAASSSGHLILWANPIMETLFLQIEDPRYGSLVVSMILFFIPTSILGMIAPYSVRLLVQSTHGSGHVAGKLEPSQRWEAQWGPSYFVLPGVWFEVNQILITMFVALVAAGCAAILTGKFQVETG